MIDLPTLLAAALDSHRFLVGPGYVCRIVSDMAETCRWELFRGNLLDPAFTREEKDFRSWHVHVMPEGQDSPKPTLSLKWDEPGQALHITRHLEVQGWEAVTAGNVIDSRPARKWQEELVGTIALSMVKDEATLAALVRHYIHLAVVGASRLPITSVESPLPLFSLGLLYYRAEIEIAPADCAAAPAVFSAPNPYQVKNLEAFLRSLPPGMIETMVEDRRWQQEERWRPLLRAIFHQVALSPHTHFVDNWVSLLRSLARPDGWGPVAVVDLVSEYLRLLVRHLTAFDLHKFHNLGANYPDALFLDALLHLYLDLLAAQPALATGPEREAVMRRRALRQGWLARRMYEGHLVPDAPTSPGENLRVLPAPYQPVPAEQLTKPQQRTRRLFADVPSEQLLTPPTRELLRHSMADLAQEHERRELGLALFLDRPLGVGKLAQGQMRDRTPLLSYIAFSSKIAQERLRLWHAWGWLDEGQHTHFSQCLAQEEPRGLPARDLPLPGCRPGVISLEDMLQVSGNFLLLYSTASSLAEFWRWYDPAPLHQRGLATSLTLLMRSPRSRLQEAPPPLLTGYDAALQPRLEFVAAGEPTYAEWAGVEYLSEGLRLVRAWTAAGEPLAVPQDVVLRPRLPVPGRIPQ